jgi:hypothetical protein
MFIQPINARRELSMERLVGGPDLPTQNRDAAGPPLNRQSADASVTVDRLVALRSRLVSRR